MSTPVPIDKASRVAVAVCTAGVAALCAAAWIWSVGGFRATVLGTLVSARTPSPSVLAALGTMGAVWLARGSRLRADIAALDAGFAKREPLLAGLLASVILAAGLSFGSTVAGGADSSGYLNQAAMWRRGELAFREPLIEESGVANAPWVFSPLGFRPGIEPGTIVPSYPPGLPLLFALASIPGTWGIAIVVPLLGAIGVWLAFVLGRSVGGPGAGLPAAVLVASSPVFLYQLVQPMTDVPVTAWWLATIVLLHAPGRFSPVLAGATAGIALATRPNLAPALVGLMPLLLFRQSRRQENGGATSESRATHGPSSPAMRFAVFAAGATPFVLLLGWFNNRLYGAPWASGYGDAGQLFSGSHVGANLRAYTVWLVDTHLILLVLAGAGTLFAVVRPPVPMGRRLISAGIAFAALVTAAYLVYAPFESWTYLRFLLPAIAVLAAPAGMAWSLALRSAPAWVRVLACTVGLTLVAGHGAGLARTRGAFELAEREQRYRLAAEWVRAHTRHDTVVVCAQHSGSIRHTAGRTVVRFDAIVPTAPLPAPVSRPIGIVLDADEEPAFRARLAGTTDLGRLDWPPRAATDPPSSTRVYLAADRQPYREGHAIVTERIAPPR